MSARIFPVPTRSAQPKVRPRLEIVKSRAPFPTFKRLRAAFWIVGLLLAIAEAWVFRFQTSADSISYLDMSDGVMPGGDWHRLINGTWSPLYPLLLGLFRRIFHISLSHEIVAAHLLNVVFFALAFVCFEFFLASFMRRVPIFNSGETLFPAWAFTCVVYSLFLWSSIFAITLEYLRPDMLMSCFLYSAMGILLKMADKEARWNSYVGLGIILGIGFLAKEPMLPLSVVIIAASLFLVNESRQSLKMAATALMLVLCIGALYFVPLSFIRGKFTLGESGDYNYLVHVDRAQAGFGWYLKDPGHGSGKALHPPQEIFSTPPVYAFTYDSLVTHPLRFDPSWWMQGMRPRFYLKRQIGETYASFADLGRSLRQLSGLIALIIGLALITPKQILLDRIGRVWPILLIGAAGCGVYLAVHVEARYVGSFVVLFFCAALSCFPGAPSRIARVAVAPTTLLVIATLLVPGTLRIRSKYFVFGRGPNEDALAAQELRSLGIQPGDCVGRISHLVTDLAIERIARLEVVDEVDFSYAPEFWAAPPTVQNEILRRMALYGAKAVIATQPTFSAANQSEWKHLAASNYWVWLPSFSQAASR